MQTLQVGGVLKSSEPPLDDGHKKISDENKSLILNKSAKLSS